MAFTFHSIAIGLRDLGMTMNPQGAHYTLMGTETLSLRMDKHVANARLVAEYLESHPKVSAVTYAGLPSSPWYHRAQKICPRVRARCSPSAQGRLRTPHAADQQRQALQPCGEPWRCPLAHHPFGLDHAPATDAGNSRSRPARAPTWCVSPSASRNPRDIIADLEQALNA